MGQPVKKKEQELNTIDIKILTLPKEPDNVIEITYHQSHLNLDGTPDRRWKANQERDKELCKGSNRTSPLTDEELDRVISYCRQNIAEAKTPSKKFDAQRNLCMITCAIVVMFRASDFLEYKYEDIFDSNWNYRNDFRKKVSKNGAEVRVIYTDNFKKSMDDFLALQKEQGLNPKLDDYVFVSHKYYKQIQASDESGMSREQWWRICTKIIKGAGINKTYGTHGNRKTGAMNFVNGNSQNYSKALRYTTIALGQKNEENTEYYVGIEDVEYEKMQNNVRSFY